MADFAGIPGFPTATPAANPTVGFTPTQQALERVVDASPQTRATVKRQPTLFEENPLKAIGLLLRNVGAGIQGKPLPSDQFLRQKEAARLRRFQELDVTLQAVDRGIKACRSRAAGEQRKACVAAFAKQFDEVGLSDSIAENLAGALEGESAEIEALTKSIPLLDGNERLVEKLEADSGGDPAAARKLLLDKDYIADLKKNVALELRPLLAERLKQARDLVEETEGAGALARISADGRITEGELAQILNASGNFVDPALREAFLNPVNQAEVTQAFKDVMSLDYIPSELAATLREKQLVSDIQADKEIGVARETAAIQAGKELDVFLKKRGIEAGDPGSRDDLKFGLQLRAGGISLDKDNAPDLTASQREKLNAIAPELSIDALTANKVGRTAEDLEAAAKARTEGTRAAKAEEEVSSIAERMAITSNLLQEFQKEGRGTVGVRGAFANFASGIVGQFNKEAGISLSEFVSGADPATLQALTQQSRTIVAQSIPQLTGEEGARVTEPERELTNEALRLLEPGASFEQVVSALETGLILDKLGRTRREFEQNKKLPDLTDEKTRRRVAKELLDLGLSIRAATRGLSMLNRLNQLLSEANG